jgi:hypothetical protein
MSYDSWVDDLDYGDEDEAEDEDIDAAVAKPVLWKSHDGAYVVVEGPFPDGFPRTLAYDSFDRACREPHHSIQMRGPTELKGKFAKTYWHRVKDSSNEFGEIAP